MTLPGRWLLYIARYKGVLVLGVLCLLAANLFKAAVPLVLQRSVDMLNQGGTHSRLLRYSVLVIAFGLLQGLAVFAQERFLLGAARSIERDMKRDFYEHLQKLSLSFFQENSVGDLMARSTNDIGVAINSSTEAFMYCLDTFTALVVILPLMFRLSWRLTALSFAPLLLVTIATMVMQKQIRARFEKVQECFGQMSARAQEALSSPKTIRTYMRERTANDLFEDVNRKYFDYNLRATRFAGLLYPLLQLFIGLSFIAVLWYGGDLTADRRLSIGEFLEFILYLGYLVWPMHQLGWELAVFQHGVVSMRRVDLILSLQPTVQDSAFPAPIAKLDGAIEFRNVTFKYKGADWPALRSVSFRIHPGQTVGLLGAVGSGKSTLMNLVPRLLDPCSGDVLIDGYSVRQIPLKVLRAAIGYVPQETFLFSDTIAANIAFGSREAAQEQIEQAAITAGLASDIAAFPKGYETTIGERGITLSGGQKQRVSIARAVLSCPAILLLDDALSSVDSYTEEKILLHLRKTMQGKTCLISSNRISTLRNADLIIVLHEGKIVEQGTHDELLISGGLYAETYAMQILEEDLAAS